MRTTTLISQCALILLLMGPMLGWAQSPRRHDQLPPTKEKEGDSWPRTPETMEHDLQVQAEIELRQAERRKALEAVEQILTLARRLKTAAERKERLNLSETLETIQKQAKRIRSLNGGGESDQEIEKWPSSLEAGATQIIALAEGLKQQLETLDSRVISVTIIDGCNAIVQLSDYLREHWR